MLFLNLWNSASALLWQWALYLAIFWLLQPWEDWLCRLAFVYFASKHYWLWHFIVVGIYSSFEQVYLCWCSLLILPDPRTQPRSWSSSRCWSFGFDYFDCVFWLFAQLWTLASNLALSSPHPEGLLSHVPSVLRVHQQISKLNNLGCITLAVMESTQWLPVHCHSFALRHLSISLVPLVSEKHQAHCYAYASCSSLVSSPSSSWPVNYWNPPTSFLVNSRSKSDRFWLWLPLLSWLPRTASISIGRQDCLHSFHCLSFLLLMFCLCYWYMQHNCCFEDFAFLVDVLSSGSGTFCLIWW